MNGVKMNNDVRSNRDGKKVRELEVANLADNLTTLQDLLLPYKAAIDALYIRYLSGHAEVTDRGLELHENAKISLNSYFNSFYESYWRALSGISNLCLEIECTGSVIVEVFRDTKDHGCGRIALFRVEEPTGTYRSHPASIAMDLGTTGRLFVDITALKKSTVSAIRFVTDAKPKCEPRLSIGICTFNRERFLLNNLRALLKEEGLKGSLAKIVVVNQGPSFNTPELSELVANTDQVLLIEQGNLGGCGGFTRSMHEALQLEGVTHHVLMDDDAVIEARVLRTLVSLLSFTGNSNVIGGHMLDLLRPHYLYEAGALVMSNTRLKPLYHNIDLRAVDALIPFSKYQEVDYNAWWFCAIPIEQIRKSQLPVPIFIRGDDMEYGIRLQELGVKTVAMPGIAVWHEPFYVKVGGWQVYYDLRNRLIMASTYPRRFRHEAPIDVLWWMLKAAASHDYLTCELFVRATHDFLSGPDLFARSADEIHAEISALAKTLAQPSVHESDLPERPAKLRRMPKSDLSLALLVVWRIGQNLLAGKTRGAKLLFDHEADLSNIGPHAYVKTNGVGSYHLLYEPNRERLFGAVRKAFVAWWAYVRNRDKAAKAWAERVPEFRAPHFWQSVFDTDAAKRQAVSDKPVAK